MLATFLAVLAVSLHAGDVITVPPDIALVVPGQLNWLLRDRGFEVATGTQAIVVRVAPERLYDVIEVKLFDGTNRLGWLEHSGLTSVRTTIEERRWRTLPDRPDVVKSYGVVVNPKIGHRNGHTPNFAAVDAMIAGGIETQGLNEPHPGGARSLSVGSHICGKPTGSMPGYCQRRVAAGSTCPDHG